MKKAFLILISALLAAAFADNRRQGGLKRETFTIETVNKTTPVKNQGNGDLCWIYAMLATIESDRLMQGDSVNLSADFVARLKLRRSVAESYTAQAQDSITLRGTAPLLLRLLDENGVMPYDSYHSECSYSALCRRLSALTKQAVRRRAGLSQLLKTADDVMDTNVNPLPKHVYMLGAEYTPVEFAHSVCLPGEYVSLTSFTHEPFYKSVRLGLPDNLSGELFLNVPIDSLLNRVVKALRSGRSVCWEGDVSEPGFSFKEGVARLQPAETDLSQQARQRMFETFKTTDDHCLELTGIAYDSAKRPYFVCKNSWGADNPYHGFMFMSFDYARMKTIAVVMKSGNQRLAAGEQHLNLKPYK